jgi:cobalamin synthase
MVLTFIIAGITTKWIQKKIGGSTGDTLGFINEFSQVMFLLLTNVIL